MGLIETATARAGMGARALSALARLLVGVVGACSVAVLLAPGLRAEAKDRAGADDATPPLFMFGEQQVGFALGYGHGADFGLAGAIEGKDVQELIVLVDYQIDVTRPPISDRWWSGRLAFRAEATAFVNFTPRTGWAGGLGLLLRYRFLHWGRVQPYTQIGAGFLGLDYEIVDQADGFAFMPQFGLGVVWQITPRHSLDLGWRYHHISNAYTHYPNGGIDTMQLLLGYDYHFAGLADGS